MMAGYTNVCKTMEFVFNRIQYKWIQWVWQINWTEVNLKILSVYYLRYRADIQGCKSSI